MLQARWIRNEQGRLIAIWKIGEHLGNLVASILPARYFSATNPVCATRLAGVKKAPEQVRGFLESNL